MVQRPLPQAFDDGARKDEARPLAGVSVLCSIQCLDTVGWVSRRTFWPLKSVPLISKCFLLEQVEAENLENGR